MPHHLPEHRLPLATIIFGADAKGRQARMSALRDLIRFNTTQDVDLMPRSKPFFGAQDCGL